VKFDFEGVNARGVAAVARLLGFTVQRSGSDFHAHPCPACGANNRHPSRKDKRGAVAIVPGGRGWHCYQCEAKGDACTFASFAVTNAKRPPGGNWGLVTEALEGVMTSPMPASPAAEVKSRPPGAELEAMWAACYRLDAVPSEFDSGEADPGEISHDWCAEVRLYLSLKRKFELSWLLMADVARILPPPNRYPYPAWWPAKWARTWRLVVGAYEADGTLASIHARAIVDDVPPIDGQEQTKTRWPRGCDATRLLFADCVGRAFLRGELGVGELDAVVVAEGLTDTLAAAEAEERAPRRRAVLGVVEGAAPAFASVRWPAGVACIIATDNDDKGNKYEAAITAALKGRAEIRRVDLAGGAH
jgi:hypothetical protein